MQNPPDECFIFMIIIVILAASLPFHLLGPNFQFAALNLINLTAQFGCSLEKEGQT